MSSLRRFLVLVLALPLISAVPASWGTASEGAACEQASAQSENSECCDALALAGGMDCGLVCGVGHVTAIALMPVAKRARTKGAPQISFESFPAAAFLRAPDTAPPRLTFA